MNFFQRRCHCRRRPRNLTLPIYVENESTESHAIFGKVEFIRVENLGNQFYQA